MLRFLPVILTAGVLSAQSGRPPDIPFQVHMVDGGASEVVTVADLNKD